jgi:hypothetical protein
MVRVTSYPSSFSSVDADPLRLMLAAVTRAAVSFDNPVGCVQSLTETIERRDSDTA